MKFKPFFLEKKKIFLSLSPIGGDTKWLENKKGFEKWVVADIFHDRNEAFVGSTQFLLHCLKFYKDLVLNTSGVGRLRKVVGNVRLIMGIFSDLTQRWNKDGTVSITDLN